MGGNLDDSRIDSFIDHLPESFLEEDSVRCRIFHRICLVLDLHLDRPDDTCCFLIGTEYAFQQIGHARLAIRTSDTDDTHFLRWMIVESIRYWSQSTQSVLHKYDWNGYIKRALGKYCSRSLILRLFGKCMSVDYGTIYTNE